MKQKILTLLFCLATLAATAQIQPTTALIGSWSGKLKFGPMSLTLVLHLELDSGHVVAYFDSPDQGAKDIPANKIFLSNDSLAVGVESLDMTYCAKLKEEKLDGTFTQRGHSLPLVMTKGVPELKRPQQPHPPYPYKTQEVTFKNKEDGAKLAGTLTWPVKSGHDKHWKPAVMLLVSGSGQQNRDEELMGHAPFLVLADYLARQGIATLRYDDRATASSTGGEVANATTEDFMRDAAAGLAFLRKKNKFGKIGCLGHSEGGAIAFMLAARGQTDFIISLAGPGVKGDTLLVAQSNRILELSGEPADLTTEQYRQNISNMQMPWLQWFINYDPSEDIRRPSCPVFALNGDLDCQVISSLNLPAIRRLLPSSPQNLVKEYPGLNHLFQHCTTGLPDEYGRIEETISPEVLQDIAQWIHSLE
jgi:pimeloyl-ACP methyl ester carboxylesterase